LISIECDQSCKTGAMSTYITYEVNAVMDGLIQIYKNYMNNKVSQ